MQIGVKSNDETTLALTFGVSQLADHPPNWHWQYQTDMGKTQNICDSNQLSFRKF